MSKQLARHPLSAVFPSMSPDAFEELKSDINLNGVQEKIIIYEGMVLDGWHRYSACIELNVKKPPALEYDGTDPVAFVESKNLHRRHMTESQRAFAVAQLHTIKTGAGRPNKFSNVTELTQSEAANIAGVSVAMMHKANKAKSSEPEVIAAVVSGDISVHQAAKLADMPVDVQRTAVMDKKAGVRPDRPAKEDTVPMSEFVQMEGMYEEMCQNYDVMAQQLKAYQAVVDGDAVQEIQSLQAQVASLTKSRDEWQMKANEMKKQLNSRK